MNTTEEIYNKIHSQYPIDYRVNEIIAFAYPFRKIKARVTSNKQPEASLQQIYSVIVKAVEMGMQSEQELCQFLGISKDDFLVREFYFLREKGYLDLVSDKWLVTSAGKEFTQDNSVLMVLQQEDFEFYIDGITGEVRTFHEPLMSKEEKKLPFSIENYAFKTPALIEDRGEKIADLYKEENQNAAYIIDIDKENLLFDKVFYQDYWLIEYIPFSEKSTEKEPFVEIRSMKSPFHKEKELSQQLQAHYPSIVYDLTDSERNEIAEIPTLVSHKVAQVSEEAELENLSIWQTQQKFKEALETTQKAILIESPWIKRATQTYLPQMEKLLKAGKSIVIIYGIEEKDEHDITTLRKVEALQKKFPDKMKLIHLPTYADKPTKMKGTHRKLLIKDTEYYISGSFNFLSFNKKEGESVANEESHLIRKKVKDKLQTVLKEYNLANIVNIGIFGG